MGQSSSSRARHRVEVGAGHSGANLEIADWRTLLGRFRACGAQAVRVLRGLGPRPLVTMAALLLVGTATTVDLAEAQRPSSQTRSFTFYVREGWIATPDGSQVYVWGFTEDPNGVPMVPGPPIVVDEGDSVEITLVNDRDPTASDRQPLGEGHTIHLHGLDVPTEHDGVPETHPAGLVRQGGSFTYRFVASHAGTYFYHCHQNNVEHQQMGMYGPIIVHAANGAKTAYTHGPSFQREHTLVLAEFGAAGHEQARRAVKEGGDPYNWLRFRPDYFLVNDQMSLDRSGTVTALASEPGERVLVRAINAGYIAHSLHAHGQTFSVVATDGRPWPAGPVTDTIWLGPGEKYDLLFDAGHASPIALHDHVDQPYRPALPIVPGQTYVDTTAEEAVRTLTLYVRDGWKTLPDGASIYVYGFTDDPSGDAKVPGPPIVAHQGETLDISLVNDRDPTGRGHALQINGLHDPTSAPTRGPPGWLPHLPSECKLRRHLLLLRSGSPV